MSIERAEALELPSGWTDSHCHLQDVDAADAVLERAGAAGVARVVCVGTGLESSRRAVEIARSAGEAPTGVPSLWCTVGLHPHDAKDGAGAVVALAGELVGGTSAAPRGAPGSVVGIGECGLDYHYDHSPRDLQREAFSLQIAAARALDLALVVHTRDAWDDTFAVLDEQGVPERTIIHCFTGGPDEARRCLDAGAYLSFSGIITFKGAPEIREAAAICPVDRVLVETDAPFLAPVPQRGRPNEPAFVSYVGAALAEAMGLAVAEVAAATNANAAAVFALPAPAPRR